MELDLSAFGSGVADPFVKAKARALSLAPEVPDDWPRDADGIPIAELWKAIPGKWAILPLATRQSLAYKPAADPATSNRAYVPHFSTAYAIEWGESQGWKLRRREWFDRGKREEGGQRHHDVDLGMDAIMESPTEFHGVQGAGKGERAIHWKRFEDRGGVAGAKKRNMRIWYVEFQRGDKTPVLVEQWA